MGKNNRPKTTETRSISFDAALLTRLHFASLVNGLFPTPKAAFATSTVMTPALVEDIVERFGRALRSAVEDT